MRSGLALAISLGWVLALLPQGKAGALAPQASTLPRVSVQSDIVYGTADGVSLLMDVYSPTTGTPPYPGIILVHGGGFYSGDKSDPNMVRASKIFAALGYVAFNINYRLAPAYPYPAADEDAQQAVIFARTNAGRFNVDPARLAIAGSSAGSTIGAWVGLVGTGPLDTGSRVAAIVTWSGALDLVALASELPPNDPRLNPIAPGHGWLPSGPDLPQAEKAASPITYVDPTDPPMLMLNAAHELTPIQQPQLMLAKLQRAGIASRMITLPGTTHALQGANFFLDMLYAVIFFDRELDHSSGLARLVFGTKLLPPIPHDTPIVRALFLLALIALAIWALAEIVLAIRPRARR
jgi:acetyl esterase/lipase